MKRISVCIATYNGAAFIQEQLVSIIKQLDENDEIIISDDGSTDNTLTLINKLNDKRIQVYFNQGKKGVIHNFANAFSHAQGGYIFLADQDDIWEEGRVSITLEYLQQHDLVNVDCTVFDSASSNILCHSFFELKNSGRGFFKNFYKNTYFGCCMAFKREMLNYILPIPTRVCMHDVWIGLLTEFYGKVLFLKKPLIKYRRHGNNASFTSEVSKNSFTKKLSMRFWLLYYYIGRILKIV